MDRSRQGQTGIRDFNGHYEFLNNDYPAWVSLDGMLFPSVAIAYQAARTHSQELRQRLCQAKTYDEYREVAMSIVDPPEWGIRKYRVMERLVRDKFKRSRELSGTLAATVPQVLTNTYEEGGEVEQYWGVVSGRGNNTLGKILMSVRKEIAEGVDTEKWVEDQGVEGDHRKRREVTLLVSKQNKPIDKLYLQKKAKFMLGKAPTNDFVLQHPSISKNHACLYYAIHNRLMLVDLGSSNRTFVSSGGTKPTKLQPFTPRQLKNGDLLVFGNSSRQYTVQFK